MGVDIRHNAATALRDGGLGIAPSWTVFRSVDEVSQSGGLPLSIGIIARRMLVEVETHREVAVGVYRCDHRRTVALQQRKCVAPLLRRNPVEHRVTTAPHPSAALFHTLHPGSNHLQQGFKVVLAQCICNDSYRVNSDTWS